MDVTSRASFEHIVPFGVPFAPPCGVWMALLVTKAETNSTESDTFFVLKSSYAIESGHSLVMRLSQSKYF